MQDEGTEPTGTEELQLNSDVSVPAQVRPLIQMGPVPSPKAAAGKVLVTENKSDAIYSRIYQECLLLHSVLITAVSRQVPTLNLGTKFQGVNVAVQYLPSILLTQLG